MYIMDENIESLISKLFKPDVLYLAQMLHKL